MVLYTCDLCDFSSKLKTDYNRHLKTKKHIHNNENSLSAMVMIQKDPTKTQKDPQKTQKDPTFKCEFCESTFTTFAHKRRHELHRCKENPDITNKIISFQGKKIKKLEKEKKKMGKEIEKLLNSVSTVTNSNSNNNSHNNSHNNVIVVNNYGKENTNYLTPEYLKQLLNKPYGAIQDIIKKIHFHPKHPENHNVKITNKKLPHALVWNDKIWETRNKKQVIEDLVDKGYFLMDTTNETVEEKNNKYDKFQSNYEETKSEIKECIEKDTELILINETKKINND